MIAKKVESTYKYITGTLSHFQDDSSLKARLTPGSYVIYTKFDPSINLKTTPMSASLSVYSLHYCIIDTLDRLKCDKVLK